MESEIKRRLSGPASRLRIACFERLGSTNDYARQRAAAGEPEGIVVIASEQWAGRGRMGRAFFSPAGTGLYMSLLLRPALAPEDAPLVTPAAAVAAAEAIEAVAGKKTAIKWPNDIFISGKKVCGILCEASLPDYAVLGIGVNIAEPPGGFPAELRETAGWVFDENGPAHRAPLAAEILNRFMAIYSALPELGFREGYSSRLLSLGREIRTADGTAVILGIDSRFGLRLRYADGAEITKTSGEIWQILMNDE